MRQDGARPSGQNSAHNVAAEKAMVSSIIANTPPWVWGLLAVLLALGISQLFTRRAGRHGR